MGRNNVFLALVMMAIGVREIAPSKDAMTYITSGFVKVLEECKKEVSAPFKYSILFGEMEQTCDSHRRIK